MNNSWKSGLLIAIGTALLTGIIFVGYSFWMKDRVIAEMTSKQKQDMATLQSSYDAQFQKFSTNVLNAVEATNKTLNDAIAKKQSDLFLDEKDEKKAQEAKVNALADALMVRLAPAIPSPEEQQQGYNAVSKRVAERIQPILTQISESGDMTRADMQKYSNAIIGTINGAMKDELKEKQQLNNNLLAATSTAEDSLRLSQEMSALYLSSLKDQGLLTRILSLPVNVVKDVSTMSIVGSSDRKKVQERLFKQMNDIQKRLDAIKANMPDTDQQAKPAAGTETKADSKTESKASSSQPATETKSEPVRAKPTPPPPSTDQGN